MTMTDPYSDPFVETFDEFAARRRLANSAAHHVANAITEANQQQARQRRTSIIRALALTAYIGSIVAANWLTATFGLVPIGFGLLVTAGTFAAGIALVARDWVQTTSGKALVFVAILAGAALSYFTSSPALALASGLAFLVSELVDLGVFSPLRDRSLPAAVLVSSIVSAPVDTVLFLWIAGFPLTWQAVLGQFLVKTAIAGLVALALVVRDREAVAV
jgi:queuosine precursor transporter